MLIDRIVVRPEHVHRGWPFDVPAIEQIAAEGLQLRSGLVVLVGANGSGKSTLIEAVAEAYGIDVRGGHGGRRYASPLEKGPLGAALELRRSGLPVTARGRRGSPGFFLRAETAYDVLEVMTGYGVQGYGDGPASQVSHGESYLRVIGGRFRGAGLYLLDEAEGPLSFDATLALLDRLREISTERSTQVIYATHSPLVAALPGAQILELNENGITERAWEDLEMTRLWRAFLARPDRFFE